jgi:hypothetical protein
MRRLKFVLGMPMLGLQTHLPKEGIAMINSWTKWLFVAMLDNVRQVGHVGRRHPA